MEEGSAENEPATEEASARTFGGVPPLVDSTETVARPKSARIETKVTFEDQGGKSVGCVGRNAASPGKTWWRWLGISKKDISKTVKTSPRAASTGFEQDSRESGGSSIDGRTSPSFAEDGTEPQLGPRIPSGLRAGAEIGSGSFANVYLARQKGSGHTVALKFIRHPTGHRPRSPRLREDDPFGLSLKPTSPRTLNETKFVATSARREVEIHRALEHPHIVQLQSYILEVDYTALVVEYLPHCMFDLCRQKHPTIVLPRVPIFARHVLLALAYMHSVGVAHRDIKLENILVSGDYQTAKICDLGLATFFRSGERSKEHCGSPHYAAPELMMGSAYDPPAADMWSAGVALYAATYAVMPFPQRDPHQLMLSVTDGDLRFPDHPLGSPEFRVPKAWRLTLDGLLDKNAARRPTAAQALASTWIQSARAPSPRSQSPVGLQT